MSKTLIAYFSASGVTRSYAKTLAQITGGDLFEIRPEKPYTKADLNWMDRNSRTTLETKDPQCRPVIAETCTQWEQYETVFLGFPIWWYVAPRIIETFLETYDFSGKTVIPFATSGESGLGKTEEVLKRICRQQANWKPGKLLNHMKTDDLTQWVKGL